MSSSIPVNQALHLELESLKARLAVAEETLSAIYNQEVDALIVGGPGGEQVFTLQGAESSYRLLVEAMNEGALTLIPDGTILYCNRRFAEMVSYPMEQVIGAAWPQFFPPSETTEIKKLLKKSSAGGGKGEFRIQTSAGALLPVHLSARPMSLAGVEVFSVLVTDVTELEMAHQALHRANEQLESRVKERTWELAHANEILRAEMAERKAAEQALAEAQEKLRRHADDLERQVKERTARLVETVAELEAFSYTVSHDLRAPLRSVQSFSQILLEECAGKLSPEQMDYLHRVIASANGLDKLILDVLAYSRTARADIVLNPVSLSDLTRSIIDNNPSLQKPAAQVTIEGALPQVLAHKASLLQCAANLLDNAVKFVPPKRIPRVMIWAENVGAEARIWFEDNGIGIAPCNQERIFKIFERIHPVEVYSGTGIGLSIVKRAIERMGGKVGVESELNRGSRFWIQLPRATKLYE
ncbi:MAG TPA: ATP-binding protein [Verrucomicrobiae bacterium]|nr:ATP-binding protein [Verrucomicrobiae bacterium]